MSNAAPLEVQTTVSLTKLLSSLSDACQRGCQVIQAVQRKRSHPKKQDDDESTSASASMSVQYKVADDPRSALTEADVASQKIILYCLRHVWGEELNIIGEEDDDDDDDDDEGHSDSKESNLVDEAKMKAQKESDLKVFEKYNVPTPHDHAVLQDIFNKDLDTDTDTDIDLDRVEMKDLCLYIDPMDGTREFVEGRLQNVQCLIGVTYKGQPVGGVVGLPFVSFDNTCSSKDVVGTDTSMDKGTGTDEYKGINVVCALQHEKCNIIDMVSFEQNENSNGNATVKKDGDKRTWISLEQKGADAKTDDAASTSTSVTSKVKVFTGDSNRIHKTHALKHLSSYTTVEPCVAGGCGNKILRTVAYAANDVEHHNAIAIMVPGTCSWDTAAPTAMVLAAIQKFNIVAKVTDLFGGDMVYHNKGTVGSKVTNDLGCIVSCGKLAVECHEKLCVAMRADAIILDSLLRKYWSVTDKDISLEEGSKIQWQNAQMKPQNVHIVRNDLGYVMTCEEVERLVRSVDESSSSNCKMVGYTMPDLNKLQLFWNISSSGGSVDDSSPRVSKSPPDVVQYQKNDVGVVELKFLS